MASNEQMMNITCDTGSEQQAGQKRVELTSSHEESWPD